MKYIKKKAKYTIKHKIYWFLFKNGKYKFEHVTEEQITSISDIIKTILLSLLSILIYNSRKEIAATYNNIRRNMYTSYQMKEMLQTEFLHCHKLYMQ